MRLPSPTTSRHRPADGPPVLRSETDDRGHHLPLPHRIQSWRDLPETFGKWQTVWTWHHPPRRPDGTWDANPPGSRPSTRQRMTRLDLTVRRLHDRSRTSTRDEHQPRKGISSNYKDLLTESPDHAFGRSRGGLSTKTHQLVDGHGLAAGVNLHRWPGRRQPDARPSVGQPSGRSTHPPGRRPWRQGLLIESEPVTAAVAEDRGSHLRTLRSARPSSPGEDPRVAVHRSSTRSSTRVAIVIERGYARLKQWRGLATRYDKLAVVYRAAVVLNGVIAWLQNLSDTP